jgi:hypothetical protein
MTPFALLHTFQQVYAANPPPCYLLRVRGYGFELGESMSAEAAANLTHAAVKVHVWLASMQTTENV